MYTTRDGRTLGYDDVGDPSGRPVVYLHGTPDSRLARPPDDGLLAEAGVRLVAVDRPGYGASSPPVAGASARQVHEQFAADLGALLTELSLASVQMLAWSGGTLQALATAATADWLSRLTIVAGVAPREAYDDEAVAQATADRRAMIEAAEQMPPEELAEMVAPMLAPYPCDEAHAAEHQQEHRSPGDQAALSAIPGALDQMAAALTEAVRGGLSGVEADLAAQYYPDVLPPLGKVRVPVHLWYGTDDQVTPAAIGRWYAQHLPDARLRTVEGAGHVVFFTHWQAILAQREA